jgi:hypothetical protein
VSKPQITIVAALLAAAAVLGAVAMTHTVSLGAALARPSDAKLLARAKQLDRFEASLRRALARTPPALPKIPKAAAAAAQQAGPSAPAAPRVVYQRPPAIVVVRHLHHGDDGSREAEDGGEAGD